MSFIAKKNKLFFRLKLIQEALKRQTDLIAQEKRKILKRRSEQKRKMDETGSSHSSPTSANKKMNSSQSQSPSSQFVQNTPSSLLPLALGKKISEPPENLTLTWRLAGAWLQEKLSISFDQL
mgnify:CR=1 FL=1